MPRFVAVVPPEWHIFEVQSPKISWSLHSQ